MTRRERLKKLLDRRKQRDRVIIVNFDPHGGPAIRPVVIGGTSTERDAILARWDAEHPNVSPRRSGHWTETVESSRDSSAQPGAPAPSTQFTSTQLNCRCGAVVEVLAGGRVTCQPCGRLFGG